ncbi:phosphatidylserine decarboxylase [Methanohalophilus levihalophilus]|uniref:phosphatidylserine decarboxylase n=1 Tax=Methanohalophilus levihalophilus TaxID=1431282 RepID=UPI001AE19944|nr:phosphatidylserine decarboxylase [Methanohalophilus levihalophilus]MBP2030271.1 phosphatidylserine decarboxylase [Methanohalophilus levihalophilus]
MLAKGSYLWILSPAVCALAPFFLYLYTQLTALLYPTGFFSLVTVFFIIFFRDPVRDVKVCKNCILSPADGKVVDIRGNTICIFMNVHNVHVNRAPFNGTIVSVEHKNGSLLPAFSKDSWRNERTEIAMSTAIGDIKVTQIAGMLARRIVSYVKEGDEVIQGQRIGMIRLGSRVDVTVPDDFEISRKIGDKVLAGQSRLAIAKDYSKE